MKEKFYVLLGDIISSRKIKNKNMFQKRLEKCYKKINTIYSNDLYAEMKVIKGIDEMGCVLSSISNCYKIIRTIQNQLYPHNIRFVIIFNYIDTALKTKNITKMDGPVFHIASKSIFELKDSKLIFDVKINDNIIDELIKGQLNSLYLIKKKWSNYQRKIINLCDKNITQNTIAKKLGISQQAVSKNLKLSMWYEIKSIEDSLNSIFNQYDQRRKRIEINDN